MEKQKTLIMEVEVKYPEKKRGTRWMYNGGNDLCGGGSDRYRGRKRK